VEHRGFEPRTPCLPGTGRSYFHISIPSCRDRVTSSLCRPCTRSAVLIECLFEYQSGLQNCHDRWTRRAPRQLPDPYGLGCRLHGQLVGSLSDWLAFSSEAPRDVQVGVSRRLDLRVSFRNSLAFADSNPVPLAPEMWRTLRLVPRRHPARCSWLPLPYRHPGLGRAIRNSGHFSVVVAMQALGTGMRRSSTGYSRTSLDWPDK
jgi:hypothetical protein